MARKKTGWVRFVAFRYLRSRRRERKLSTSLLSISGIAVGVLALNIVIGVMNGFQLGTIHNILELTSFHIQIESGVLSGVPGRALHDRTAELPGVRSVVRFGDIQALASGYFSDLQGVRLRALDPGDWRDEMATTEAPELVALQGRLDFSEPGSIVLGRDLAQFLGVQAGDRISLVAMTSPDLDLRNPDEVELRVTGLFESGYYPFDRSWGLISLETLTGMFDPAAAVSLGVKLKDSEADRAFIGDFLRAFPSADSGKIHSWRVLNSAIFGALRVEKGIMFFLVSLIFLVVGVNIYQGLRRIIHERRGDIAIMRALGAPVRRVEAVFLVDGLVIGGAGAGLGTLFGVLVGENINPIIRAFENLFAEGRSFANDFFYLDSLPLQFVAGEVALVGLFGAAAAILAAAVAARAVRSAMPIELLREE